MDYELALLRQEGYEGGRCFVKEILSNRRFYPTEKIVPFHLRYFVIT